MKPDLIIIAGPTAVGKSALSIRLAHAINGEIISADSMQVYRGMNIGSAKITTAEMDGIPHYLIDELEPEDEFNVVDFQKRARECIKEIQAKGKIPIIVGGTGFYIQSVLYDIDFESTEQETGYRAELSAIGLEKGPAFLHAMLREVDPVAADQIHENNMKRVIRALEYYHLTGTPISAHNLQEREKPPAYYACYFVLKNDREALYRRINERIDQMLKEGLIEEVQALKFRGCTKDMVSMQGLGYKEILSYLNGECTLEEAIYILKRDTRHFAKRQLTWFRRERDVIWMDRSQYTDEEHLLQDMLQIIKEHKTTETKGN
ncbi:MAG: tRNA (adenosine(37)-N6)-dimethylallyltransferase MiaA [bacterium]|nr:tRNA (adenosine(37)-N6)-dimethylallyltransferase MiaA [bacterium]